MGSKFSYGLRCAALVFVAVAGYRQVAFAGTTGTITGTVIDATTKAPIAGATVSAVSPSQVARRNDRCVGPVYLPLAFAPRRTRFPRSTLDTTTSRSRGSRSLPIRAKWFPSRLQKSLKQIARVTSRSSLSPVRPGTGTDVYSVNPGLTTAAATLGGGGGLNNAYSAIASMPGAYVPPNQVGVNQTVYIRGGYYDQIGYEYDGVPINRSFDNYPGNSETTLGQQELQIYTGGGEADANATGLGRLHQSGDQDRNLSRATRPAAWPSARRRSITTRASRPAARRPTECSPTTSASAERIKTFATSTSSTARSLTDTIPYGYWPAHITTFLPAFYPAVYPACRNNGTLPLIRSSAKLYQRPRLFRIVSLELRAAV